MSSSGATAFKTRALQASILLLCTVALRPSGSDTEGRSVLGAE